MAPVGVRRSSAFLERGNANITQLYWSSKQRRGQLYVIAFARRTLRAYGAKGL